MNDKEVVIIREKRKKPRVNKKLKFRLVPDSDSSDLSGHTNNLSCIGANCNMNRPVPEMTKVELKLDIVSEEITFEGIVVRSEEADDGTFNTAIYFDDISEKLQTKIENFINLKAIVNDK